MEFIAGIIVGVLLSLLVAVIVLAMIGIKQQADGTKKIVMKSIDEAIGVKPKGFIYMPPDEDEEARAAKIAENQRNGRTTKLSDL
jgi:hypothetical protein